MRHVTLTNILLGAAGARRTSTGGGPTRRTFVLTFAAILSIVPRFQVSVQAGIGKPLAKRISVVPKRVTGETHLARKARARVRMLSFIMVSCSQMRSWTLCVRDRCVSMAVETLIELKILRAMEDTFCPRLSLFGCRRKSRMARWSLRVSCA